MYDRQALSALIPAGVRRRDRGEDGSPLNALLRVIASQVERVRAQLFPEICPPLSRDP
jgi:hypothetical protein